MINLFWFLSGAVAGIAVVIAYGTTQMSDHDRSLIEAIDDKKKTIDEMEDEMELMREELVYLKQENLELRANKGKLEKPEKEL